MTVQSRNSSNKSFQHPANYRGPKNLRAALDLINNPVGLSWPIVRLPSGRERAVCEAKSLTGLDGFVQIRTVPDITDGKNSKGFTIRVPTSCLVVGLTPRPRIMSEEEAAQEAEANAFLDDLNARGITGMEAAAMILGHD